jgi:hypothetical protein
MGHLVRGLVGIPSGLSSLEEEERENEYVIFLRRENFDEYRPILETLYESSGQIMWYGFAEQFLSLAALARAGLDLMHFPHFNVPILYPGRFVVTIHDLICFAIQRYGTRRVFRYWYRCSSFSCIVW